MTGDSLHPMLTERIEASRRPSVLMAADLRGRLHDVLAATAGAREAIGNADFAAPTASEGR